MTLRPLIPCHIIDYPTSAVRPYHTSAAMYAIMVHYTFLPAPSCIKHVITSTSLCTIMPQINAHDLIGILSCGGSGRPIRAWQAALKLSCHCPFVVHTSTRQVMSPLSSASQWLRSQGARAHSRWPSAAQDSLLECHRTIVRSSNKPGLTSSASLTHLHAPLGGLEQPSSAYGGRSHACSPPIPHAPSNLLEYLRSCFISSIGLAGSWQGSGVFSNGTESEYSTAPIRRGAYGPPLFSLDPRAPGAESHGTCPSPYPCGLMLPCLLGPL